ncbi:MAG: hypothetical protein ACRBCI_12100 [Cellvibrionaceae bacterium]
MYQLIEERLKDSINDEIDYSVSEVWEIFKIEFSKFKNEKHPSITDLGIQTEFYLDSKYGPPCFYFAFHNYITGEDDGKYYSYYELVYCEFDLTDSPLLPNLEDASMDLWLSDNNENTIFSTIENWSMFQLFKNESFKLNIYGTEI